MVQISAPRYRVFRIHPATPRGGCSRRGGLGDFGLPPTGARILMHELLFEVADDEIETMKALVNEEMKAALPLDVPIEVRIGVADNWLDAH